MPVTDYHSELDVTSLLRIDDHCKFQMFLVMMQLMVIIEKIELCQVVLSLNRFGACPREVYLELTVRCFGYVENTINKKITIDSRPMKFNRTEPSFHKLIPDFINDYPEATEGMDIHFPSVFCPLL